MKTSKLKPFQKTTVIFWGTLLLAVLTACVYGYLFHEIRVTTADLTSLQGDTKALEDQESEVGQLKQSLAETQVNQSTLDSYFVNTNDVVPFFETFEGYGTETDTVVAFNSVTLNQSPTNLVVSLTSDGSFADVYRFLALAEAAPYEFSVTTATVSSTSADNSGSSKGPPAAVNWEASLTLTVTGVTDTPDTVAPTVPSGDTSAPASTSAAASAPAPVSVPAATTPVPAASASETPESASAS